MALICDFFKKLRLRVSEGIDAALVGLYRDAELKELRDARYDPERLL